MNHLNRIALLAAALLLFASASDAEDQAPEKPVHATANVGFVQTGGNTEVVTLLATDKLEWKRGAWAYTQEAGAVYGRDQGTENAGRYRVGLRTDYTFTPRVSLYGLASWKRDVFAGIERQFDEGAGAVYHAILPQPQLLDFELGLGLLQRRSTEPVDASFSTARVAARYKYFFTEKATFEAFGDWVVNLEDNEDSDAEARAALAAPLASGLSLSLGYNAVYRSRPLPGLERVDWTVSAGIQFSY